MKLKGKITAFFCAVSLLSSTAMTLNISGTDEASANSIILYESKPWKNVKVTGSFNFAENSFAVGDSITFKVPEKVLVGTDGADSEEWLELYTQPNSATIGGVSASGNVIDGITVTFGISNKGGASPTLAAGKRSSIPFTVELGWVENGSGDRLDETQYNWAVEDVGNFTCVGVNTEAKFATLNYKGENIICQYNSFTTLQKNANAISNFKNTASYTDEQKELLKNAKKAVVKINYNYGYNTEAAVKLFINGEYPQYNEVKSVSEFVNVVEFEVPVSKLYDSYDDVYFNDIEVTGNYASFTKVELILYSGADLPAPVLPLEQKTIDVWEADGWRDVKVNGTFTFGGELEFEAGETFTFTMPSVLPVNTDGGGWEWLNLYPIKDSATLGGVKIGGDAVQGVEITFGETASDVTSGSSAVMKAGLYNSIPFTCELKWLPGEDSDARNAANYSWAVNCVKNFSNTNVNGNRNFAVFSKNGSTIDGSYDSFNTITRGEAGYNKTADFTVEYTKKQQDLIKSAKNAYLFAIFDKESASASQSVKFTLNETGYEEIVNTDSIYCTSTAYIPVSYLYDAEKDIFNESFTINAENSGYENIIGFSIGLNYGLNDGINNKYDENDTVITMWDKGESDLSSKVQTSTRYTLKQVSEITGAKNIYFRVWFDYINLYNFGTISLSSPFSNYKKIIAVDNKDYIDINIPVDVVYDKAYGVINGSFTFDSNNTSSKIKKIDMVITPGAEITPVNPITPDETSVIQVLESKSWSDVKLSGTFNFMENNFVDGDSFTLKFPDKLAVASDKGSWEWLELYLIEDSVTIGGAKLNNVLDGAQVLFGDSVKDADGNNPAVIKAGRMDNIPFTAEYKWVQGDASQAHNNGNYGWAIDSLDNFSCTGVNPMSGLERINLTFSDFTLGNSSGLTLGSSGSINTTITPTCDSFTAIPRAPKGLINTSIFWRDSLIEARIIASAKSAKLRVTLTDESVNKSGTVTVSVYDSDISKDIPLNGNKVIEADVPVSFLYNSDYGYVNSAFTIKSNSDIRVEKFDLVLVTGEEAEVKDDVDPLVSIVLYESEQGNNIVNINHRYLLKETKAIKKAETAKFIATFSEVNSNPLENITIKTDYNEKSYTSLLNGKNKIEIEIPVNELYDDIYGVIANSFKTSTLYGSKLIKLELVVEHTPESVKYAVTFTDWDGTVLKSETVEAGKSATAPANPTRSGYTFAGWDKEFDNVTSDLTVKAVYTENTVYYSVVFKDWDGKELKAETVEAGTSATAPANPVRSGYTFIGWDLDFGSVTKNITVNALYVAESTTPVRIFDKAGNYDLKGEKFTGNYVISANGVTIGNFDLKGDVIIKGKGATIKDATISGSIVIEKEVGNDNAYINSVTTKKVNIKGGGSESIHITDSAVEEVVVDKEDNGTPVRVVSEGGTQIAKTVVLSSVLLENTASDGIAGFGAVEMNKNIPAKSTIVLTGAFKEIIADAPNITVVVQGTVEILTVSKTAENIKIKGEGEIALAIIDESISESVNIDVNVVETVMSFTVTFVSNGGSAVDSAEVISGYIINSPANPTKSGFEFKGWYKDSSLNDLWNFASDKVTSNITLYAKWEAVTSGKETPEYTGPGYVAVPQTTKPDDSGTNEQSDESDKEKNNDKSESKLNNDKQDNEKDTEGNVSSSESDFGDNSLSDNNTSADAGNNSSEENERNPGTGVTVAVTSVIISGAVCTVFRKKNKKN